MVKETTEKTRASKKSVEVRSLKMKKKKVMCSGEAEVVLMLVPKGDCEDIECK